MPTSPIFQPMLRTARVLWAALTGSTVLLSVLVVALPASAPRPAPPIFAPTFIAVAVATAVMSFVLPARAVGMANLRRREQELVQGPTGRVTGRPTMAFANPASAARAAFAASNTALILSLALSEAVALDGFALHMVGGPTSVALPIAIFGVALAAVRFPTVQRMVAPYEKAYGATFGEAARG